MRLDRNRSLSMITIALKCSAVHAVLNAALGPAIHTETGVWLVLAHAYAYGQQLRHRICRDLHVWLSHPSNLQQYARVSAYDVVCCWPHEGPRMFTATLFANFPRCFAGLCQNQVNSVICHGLKETCIPLYRTTFPTPSLAHSIT